MQLLSAPCALEFALTWHQCLKTWVSHTAAVCCRSLQPSWEYQTPTPAVFNKLKADLAAADADQVRAQAVTVT